jgi:hypothetical protein
MAYGNIAARHRMGLSARAYTVLHQWAAANVPGFSGRHEDMSWALVAEASAPALLQVRGCGHAALDEIAESMRAAGLSLRDHAAAADDRPAHLARGSKVYLAGRRRPMVVADYAAMGDEVLLKLRSEPSEREAD